MKSLHLYLSAILLLTASQAVHADLFGSPPHIPNVFRPVTNVQTVFRAQSDGSVPLPADAGAGASITPDASAAGAIPPSIALPSQPAPITTYGTQNYPDSTWNAFSPPLSPDPFATGGAGVQPYAPYTPYGTGNPYSGSGELQPYTSPGANGPAPYRQGWHNRFDIEWLPESSVSGASGHFEQFGVNYELGYTGSYVPGWMLTWTNQFRLRNWDGPQSGTGLPGKAFRFGWDFELESAQPGPINVKLGITPSINSDLHDSPDSTAFQLDGRGMFIFQLDQYWTMVAGAEYLDRVEDRIIPHAGFVYRDDFWEWRLMYPETTVSLFLGNEPQWAKWMYFRAEYHIEAYDVAIAGGGSDQVELEDYRAVMGFRMDASTYSWFIEGGWVFDREVNFGTTGNAGYSPNSGFITRLGWKY